MSKSTEAKVIAALDAIQPGDPELAHSKADRLLLEAVSPDVAEAYGRAVERVGAWWPA